MQAQATLVVAIPYPMGNEIVLSMRDFDTSLRATVVSFSYLTQDYCRSASKRRRAWIRLYGHAAEGCATDEEKNGTCFLLAGATSTLVKARDRLQVLP